MTVLASTFSIVGRDARGQLGIAVSSRVVAVGSRCPFVLPASVAVSSQAYLNPYLGVEILERVTAGEPIGEAAAAVLAADEGRDWRQLTAIGPSGDPFAHTGGETDPWAGHVVGDDCAAAGNLLTGEEVVGSMVEAFAATGGSLPQRLLAALEAGQAAGGDRRGRQSAALLVADREKMPFVDLRVDEHSDPVAELRRIWSLHSDDDLRRSLRWATTREPIPLEETRARQAEVRKTLADEGR
jgi:uncharacterized Ntn-hydrolase superfamily protein